MNHTKTNIFETTTTFKNHGRRVYVVFVGYNTVIKYSASFVGSQFQIHTGSNKFCPDENLGSVTIDPIKFPGRVSSLKKFVS